MTHTDDHPTPTVVLCHAEDAPELHCSPDEWLTAADRHVTDGVRRVVLDAIPEGSPWNDEPAVPDAAADTWAFAPWPGVVFVLPLDE